MADRTVIVALDFASPEQALQFATKLSPEQCAVKVGFELFVAAGPKLIEQLVSSGFRVFLDLKFHDIPNTVAKACIAASRLGVWMINVHASGGSEMLIAARRAVDNSSAETKPILLAVTLLTSLNQSALQELGISHHIPDLVKNWAKLAQQCGLDGVVCSAQEATLVHTHTAENFVIVTPGIRLRGESDDDQKRVVTPTDARVAGATCIVVGRPITQAANPQTALTDFYNAFVCA